MHVTYQMDLSPAAPLAAIILQPGDMMDELLRTLLLFEDQRVTIVNVVPHLKCKKQRSIAVYVLPT